MGSAVDDVLGKTQALIEENEQNHKQNNKLRQDLVAVEFATYLKQVPSVGGVPVMAAVLPNADIDTLRQMTDRFREQYPSGVVVLGSSNEGRPILIACVTEDLVKKGLNAGELCGPSPRSSVAAVAVARTLAQAGGKDASKLQEAIDQVQPLVKAKLRA